MDEIRRQQLKHQAAALLAQQEQWTSKDIELATGVKPDACYVCGAKATLLCDGRLPRWLMKDWWIVSEILKDEGKLRSDYDLNTCDRFTIKDLEV